MLNVVLYQPEIPPNTGNVIRLCANTGARLHLVGPLGFTLDDARLKRAGLDYHELAVVRHYPDWQSWLELNPEPCLWAFSTRGTRRHCDVAYGADDTLLFGPETRGLPAGLLDRVGPDRTLRLPMVPGSRSLNLSNASKDTSASQIAADNGVGPTRIDDVIVVFKAYPTRVGEGPFSTEMTREVSDRLGIQEFGTVSHRQRRIGDWDGEMARYSAMINGCTQAAITGIDRVDPLCFGIRDYDKLSRKALDFIEKAEEDIGAPVTLISTGPDVAHIIDIRGRIMKRTLLPILCCAVCKGDLLLTVDVEDDEEILTGKLHCQSCRVDYPIEACACSSADRRRCSPKPSMPGANAPATPSSSATA